MNIEPRFALKPLNIIYSDKAVDEEFLINPLNGHIYVKKDGKIISKTVELEERLDELDKINKLTRNYFVIPGNKIKEFFNIPSDVTVALDAEGNAVLTTVQTNKTITLSTKDKKMDFTEDVNSFYIGDVYAKSGGSIELYDSTANNIRKPTVFDNSTKFSRMSTIVVPKNNINCDQGSSISLKINFGNTNKVTIKAISMFKSPIELLEYNLTRESLVFDKYSQNRNGENIGGMWDDNSKNDIIININNKELEDGEYSLIVVFENASGTAIIKNNLGQKEDTFTCKLADYTNKGKTKTISLSTFVDSANVNLKRTITINRANLTGNILRVVLTRQPVCQFADN